MVPAGNRRTEPCQADNASAERRPRVVALVGNPNTGKTTLFNALTGFRRRVANYPGVTVDIGRGRIRHARRPLELLDLPGTYSLAAVSPDEQLVTDALCSRLDARHRPDAILAIVDASNLYRNLYLVSQLLELGLPLVVAQNMVDVARSRGLHIDVDRLSRRLGVPVVPVIATDPKTTEPLVEALEQALDDPPRPEPVELPQALVEEARGLDGDPPVCFAEGIRILLDREGEAPRKYLERGGSEERLLAARERLARAGIDGPAAEVRARYAWIGRVLDGVLARPEQPVVTWSDRVDRVLTNRFGGLVCLLVVLYVVFQSIYYGAGPIMAAIEELFARLATTVGPWLPEGMWRSLVLDGVIGGVGGVLVFLPQIMILFAFIAILEDCGYMARAAFMVDRLMQTLGLSGRAFIPLLSGFACAVPAIMGARAIADRRERFVTILLIPFMSCSARLPVYLVFIGALVPNITYLGGLVRVPALVMLAMYLVGVLVGVPVAWLLKRTVFAGPPTGFLLELPAYKLPRPRAIWQRAYLAGKGFLVRAGTIILLVNLLVWALAYFPHRPEVRARLERQRVVEGWDEPRFEAELAGAYLRDSYLGRMGRGIEPVIAPLGWDWRIGVSVLASFPAREVVVATLGTLFNLEEDEPGSQQLRAAIQKARREGTDQPLFTLPVALSLMVFFALCAQCASTLVVMGRELGSFLWPVLSFLGMTTIAYFAAWGTSAAAHAVSAWLGG